jgi:hypothetical protein
MSNGIQRTGSKLLTGILLLTLGLVAGCRGDGPSGDPGLILDVGISPTPPGVGPARLIIALTDTAGNPLSEAVVTVEGNMSHAGMVPVLDTARMTGPGQYLVDDFRFTMAGDWILTVEATLPDGRHTVHTQETDVVSVPPSVVPEGTPESAGMPGHSGHTQPSTPDTSGGRS